MVFHTFEQGAPFLERFVYLQVLKFIRVVDVLGVFTCFFKTKWRVTFRGLQWPRPCGRLLGEWENSRSAVPTSWLLLHLMLPIHPRPLHSRIHHDRLLALTCGWCLEWKARVEENYPTTQSSLIVGQETVLLDLGSARTVSNGAGNSQEGESNFVQSLALKSGCIFSKPQTTLKRLRMWHWKEWFSISVSHHSIKTR